MRITIASMEPDFSEVVAALLGSYEYSEADLAREIGVSQPTIHRIKTGEVKSPGFTTGAKLMALYESRPLPTG